MKFNHLLLLTLLSLVYACSTDFDLEAEWKDIPVVYSFISTQDTAHYVRVQKAFLEPGGDANQIATISDSIYYQNITVSLENVETGQSYVMEKVDGALEGYPKDDGFFANEPNVLYKLKADVINLQGGDEVRLVLNRGDDLPEVTAETRVIGKIDTVINRPPNLITSLLYTQSIFFDWKPDPLTQIFDIRLECRYQEISLANPSQVENKVATVIVDRNFLNEGNEPRLGTAITGANFYQGIAGQIEVNPNVYRVFKAMDLYITGAGDEFYQLIRVAQANTGITSSQSVPTYTNLSEGLGIFSSKYQLVKRNIRLDNVALDTLIGGIYTKQLDFRKN
ncbi:MAG TPA: DUF4249 family protein [Saprospiraceae bacterium]|nr:DUF4249 family protein [Saprospiraceae bacterium]HMQ81889.1 DUF4249 family protein [Saprospiraceae bacterium]